MKNELQESALQESAKKIIGLQERVNQIERDFQEKLEVLAHNLDLQIREVEDGVKIIESYLDESEEK